MVSIGAFVRFKNLSVVWLPSIALSTWTEVQLREEVIESHEKQKPIFTDHVAK
jgi:hypothetical protein